MKDFLHALAEGLEEDERLILCGFRGDPQTVGPTAWRPRPWRKGRPFPFEAQDNVYVSVSAFRKATDGSFRRRVDCFSAGLALMVDDVGTKVDRAAVSALEPTAIVETSPNNEQWWYFLRQPMRGPDAVWQFDSIIRAFISAKLLGNDPGMNGVNRVGRLPGHTNGKEQYRGFITQLREFVPDRRYTPEELISNFNLEITGRRFHNQEKLLPEDARQRGVAWRQYFDRLRAADMVKREEFDPSGWVEVRCPWMHEHTKRADTGAAVRLPSLENDFYGAFRCHHGSCADRGWGDVVDWFAEHDEEVLEDANRRAAA